MPASSRRERKPTTLAPDRRWSSLSPPAVMPLVGKSGNVLEAARNTQRRAVGVGTGRPTCPLHGHHHPARAAIMAALARYSVRQLLLLVQPVQGHTQGAVEITSAFATP
jgi:hypothetical protein